jgi:hypothetical protein
MLCIVLVAAMVGFFGLSIVAGMIVLASLSDSSYKINDTVVALIVTSIITFIGASALVWFYSTMGVCH